MGIKSFFWNIIAAGRGRNTEMGILRKILVLNTLMIPGMFFTFILGITALAEGNVTLGAIDFAVCFFQLWLLIFTRRSSSLSTPLHLAVFALLTFFLFLACQGGIENTAILWLFLFPTFAVFLMGTKVGTVLSAVMFAGVVSVFAFQGSAFVHGRYSSDFQIRFLAVYSVITLLAIISEELRRKINQKMTESGIEKEEAIRKLNKSIEEIKTLQGILPICINCKKIRDDEGYWQAVDEYIHHRTEAQFSHALCPDCAREIYPDLH